MLANSLDSRLRGNDRQLQTIVILAKLVLDSDRGAGIQLAYPNLLRTYKYYTKILENLRDQKL